MTLKPWLIDDLIVNDEDTWTSLIREGGGLPELEATQAQRIGRWPRVAGLRRDGRRIWLETVFDCSVSSRTTTRKKLLQYLNPDRTTVRRLVAADTVWQGIAPDTLVALWGPWDVYYDAGDDAWYARDLLNGYLATLEGGWYTRPGYGLEIAESTTNQIKNPVAGTGDNYASEGSATVTRSDTYSYRGKWSYHVITSADDDGIQFTMAALANAYHYSTFYVRGTLPSLVCSVDGASWSTPDLMGTDGDWSVYRQGFGAALSNGQTTFYIEQDGAGSGDFYIGAVQVEEASDPTPFCEGDMGPGHSWASDAHKSAASRTNATCTISTDVATGWLLLESGDDVLQEDDASRLYLEPFESSASLFEATGSLCGWFTMARDNVARYMFDFRGADNNNRMVLAMQADNKFDWYINGAYRITDVGGGSNADWGEEFFWAVTWDFTNDSYKLYVYEADGTSNSDSDTTSLSLPVITDMKLGSIYDGSSTFANGRLDGVAFFNRVLTAAEIAYINSAGRDRRLRHVDAICESSRPMDLRGTATDWGNVAQLAIDGDVRWRNRDGDYHYWKMDTDNPVSGTVVDNQGDDDAYPVIHVEPTSTDTAGYQYKRWIPIKWQATSGATMYPILLEIIDTNALWDAGKMHVWGYDFRVYVDGVDTPRWFGAGEGSAGGINSSTTRTWINMDFEPGQTWTLATAIGDAGNIDEIEVNESIADAPDEGILMIDDETFTYTDKNEYLKQFTGVTRGAKGSTEAAHDVDDTVWWIQHETWLYYGDPSLKTQPSLDYDDDEEPVLDMLTSNNTSWVFKTFGRDDGKCWQWSYTELEEPENIDDYTGSHGADADPWTEVGILGAPQGRARFVLYNPCGFTAHDVDTNDGGKYTTNKAGWGSNPGQTDAEIVSSRDGVTWYTEYNIPTPAADSTWEDWDDTDIVRSNVKYWGIELVNGAEGVNYVEIEEVTLTLDSNYRVYSLMDDEQANVYVAGRLRNDTTGESIDIRFNMANGEILRIDTDEKTVTYLEDNTRHQEAVSLVEGPRRDWLRLAAGENTLIWTDLEAVGNDVDIYLYWDTRRFE